MYVVILLYLVPLVVFSCLCIIIVSPLMNAINGRHKQIIHYLLSRGADPNIKSTSGRTSYDIAKRVDILNNLDSIAFHNMKLRKKEKSSRPRLFVSLLCFQFCTRTSNQTVNILIFFCSLRIS